MFNFNELLSCCIPLSPVHGEPLMFNFRDPLFFYIPQGHPFMESLSCVISVTLCFVTYHRVTRLWRASHV